MSAISLANLLQSLANQNTAQGQNAAVKSGATATGAQTSQAKTQDEFTPSAQNPKSQASAEAAGLFTVAAPSPISVVTARIQTTAPTLGRSNQQIDQLDQVASTTSNYNPSAHTAQAYELELLAHQPAPQAPAATPAPTPTPAQANAAVAKAAAGKTAST